ncbi:MAG TPA: response regulator [Aggregatilineales bacterium]|jgi:CheY-like chemotaxis protein|nr:response regulator [Aggregatilineales bacterium]
MKRDLANWTVLLVEDEVDAQDVVTSLLHQYDISVAHAYSGEDALMLLESTHPTVAIIDLALPAMDGWQVLAAMQSDPEWASIPAIAMTAYHSTHVAQEAIKAGFVAYFPKPINAHTFVQDLVSVLS